MKRIAEYEHKYGNATEELERHRKFRANYDKQQAEAEAAKKAAEEAQLSEIERVKKQHAEAEQRIKSYQQQLATAQVRMAAQAKGIIDPELAALPSKAAWNMARTECPRTWTRPWMRYSRASHTLRRKPLNRLQRPRPTRMERPPRPRGPLHLRSRP